MKRRKFKKIFYPRDEKFSIPEIEKCFYDWDGNFSIPVMEIFLTQDGKIMEFFVEIVIFWNYWKFLNQLIKNLNSTTAFSLLRCPLPLVQSHHNFADFATYSTNYYYFLQFMIVCVCILCSVSKKCDKKHQQHMHHISPESMQ